MERKQELESGELLGRLEGHPEFKAKVLKLLELMEGKEGIERSADAEKRVVEEIRVLGKEVLRGWAQGRMEELSEQEERRGSMRFKKKRCIGTAVWGKSK